jgi:quercetin dioxygenase-like cupin family protein
MSAPTAPLRLTNPAAGEVMYLHPVAIGTGSVTADVELAATHTPPPAHVHPASAETFTVTSGAVEIRVGRAFERLDRGDRVTVPAGVVHGYRNRSGAPASFTAVLDHAGGMPEFWRAVYTAAEAGLVTRSGQVRLPVAAGLLRDHLDDITLPALPRPLAAAVLTVLRHLP